MLGLLVFVGACAGSSNEEKEILKEENLDPILTPYFKIVKALQNDEFDNARKFGKMLSSADANTGVKLALTRMGTMMSESSSAYNQRALLEQLGMVIPLYIEQNMLNDYLIYKFKCKNEFDGKEVFWYGLSKKSANPFIGGNSNECVELIETIKPVIKK